MSPDPEIPRALATEPFQYFTSLVEVLNQVLPLSRLVNEPINVVSDVLSKIPSPRVLDVLMVTLPALVIAWPFISSVPLIESPARLSGVNPRVASTSDDDAAVSNLELLVLSSEFADVPLSVMPKKFGVADALISCAVSRTIPLPLLVTDTP